MHQCFFNNIFGIFLLLACLSLFYMEEGLNVIASECAFFTPMTKALCVLFSLVCVIS